MSFDIIALHQMLSRRMLIRLDASRKVAASPRDAYKSAEASVQEVVQGWLPSTMSMSRGQIVSAVTPEKSSTSVDLLIADTAEWPPLFVMDGSAIFLAESVRGAFEIKPKLMSQQIGHSLHALDSAARMKSECRSKAHRFVSCLFAFEGPSDPRRLIEWMAAAAKEYPGGKMYLPGCIIVLQKYVITAVGSLSSAPHAIAHMFSDEETEFSLLLIHEFIQRRLELQVGYPVLSLAGDDHPSLAGCKQISLPIPDELLVWP